MYETLKVSLKFMLIIKCSFQTLSFELPCLGIPGIYAMISLGLGTVRSCDAESDWLHCKSMISDVPATALYILYNQNTCFKLRTVTYQCN